MLKPLTLSFRKNTTAAEAVSQLKCLKDRKKIETYLANERSALAILSTDLKKFFGSIVGNEFELMWGKLGPNEPEFAYELVRMHSLMIYTNLIEYNTLGVTKIALLRWFIHFEAQGWRHYNYWAVHELSNLL